MGFLQFGEECEQRYLGMQGSYGGIVFLVGVLCGFYWRSRRRERRKRREEEKKKARKRKARAKRARRCGRSRHKEARWNKGGKDRGVARRATWRAKCEIDRQVREGTLRWKRSIDGTRMEAVPATRDDEREEEGSAAGRTQRVEGQGAQRTDVQPDEFTTGREGGVPGGPRTTTSATAHACEGSGRTGPRSRRAPTGKDQLQKAMPDAGRGTEKP